MQIKRSLTKKLTLLIAILSLSVITSVQTQAKDVLTFLSSKITVEEAIKKATAMDKILIIDVYADWSPLCKELDNKVFLSPVLNKLNDDYIAYKLDAEKGEGPKYAKQWGVKGYPTIILFKGDNLIAHLTIIAKQTDAASRPEIFVAMIKDISSDDDENY